MPSWTEKPHWVVMHYDAGEARCIAHYEHKRNAEEHARRARKVYTGPMVRVAVERTP